MAVNITAYPQQYGNVVLTASNISPGYSATYNTATSASTWIAEPFYTKQPKVKITDSDIEVDGLSLVKTLRELQTQMGIMVPNPALEKEFIELRKCADRYRELERKFLEQKRVWETLKKTDQ
jgi:hypothetical protein